MIVLTDRGKPVLLDQERTFLNNCELRLFRNDIVPSRTTLTSDFVEVIDSGYSRLFPIGFAQAILNTSYQGELAAQPKTWTFTYSGGPFTVFGYYIVEVSTGDTMYAERDPNPFPVTAAGAIYQLTPRKIMDTY